MKIMFKSLFASAAILSLVALSGCCHDHCHGDSKCETKECCGKDGKCCKKK